MEIYDCQSVYAVHGNHDPPQAFSDPIVDLHMAVREFGGLAWGGFEGSWAYKPRGHFMYSQDEASALLAGLAPVDILLCHNSPRGIHERDQDVHQGFEGLMEYIEKVKPKLVLHGHQHENLVSRVGPTLVAGVYGERFLEVDDDGAITFLDK